MSEPHELHAAVFSLDNQDKLLVLLKGLGLKLADTALQYVDDNIGKLDFGKLQPAVEAFTVLFVKQLQALLAQLAAEA